MSASLPAVKRLEDSTARLVEAASQISGLEHALARLVENSLQAGARCIRVSLRLSRLGFSVSDDGTNALSCPYRLSLSPVNFFLWQELEYRRRGWSVSYLIRHLLRVRLSRCSADFPPYDCGRNDTCVYKPSRYLTSPNNIYQLLS